MYGILDISPWALSQNFSIRCNMNKLEKVLAEDQVLHDRTLTKAEHATYLVRWVKEFLQFGRDKTGH